MTYHPVVTQILSLIKEKGYWHETFEHEAVRTSEDAAKLRHGYSLHQGAKALILQVKIPTVGKKFVMVVVPGDTKFDSAKVKAFFGAKEIRFATVEEVAKITGGIEPGGVPPFGNLFGLEVVADASIFENEKIIFNAGDRKFSVAIVSSDYKSLVHPHVTEII